MFSLDEISQGIYAIHCSSIGISGIKRLHKSKVSKLMGNSTSSTILSLQSVASQPAVYCRVAAASTVQTHSKHCQWLLEETNLIYRENTHNKHYERVGVISPLSCCLPIHGNNLREEADQDGGRVRGRVFASLPLFSHFETMFIHWFVIVWQLSLVYCCESPEGAEDSLRLCSASIETRWRVGAGRRKQHKINSYVISAISPICASVCEMPGKCCRESARQSHTVQPMCARGRKLALWSDFF